MIIYGAGDHGKVLLDYLQKMNEEVEGFFDDDTTIQKINNIAVHSYSSELFKGRKVVIAIGNNLQRKIIAENVVHDFISVIHPSAIISRNSHLNEGCMIMAGAIVNGYTKIGKHVIINTGSVIEHDCRIGDYVHISPNATLCGRVKVGDMSLIGAGAVVLPGIQIGNNCIVGAGSVVLNDIEDNRVVAGNPAMVFKSNKID